MFRGENVGTDTSAILNTEKALSFFILYDSQGMISRSSELLYMGLLMFISEFNLPGEIAIYFFSITTMLFLYLALKRSGVAMPIAVLVFTLMYYLLSFNIARQCLAISILLYAYTFLISEKPKTLVFFILLFVAMMFHMSSIIALLVFVALYLNIELNRKLLTTIALCITLLNVISPIPIVDTIFSFFASSVTYLQKYEDVSETLQMNIFGKLNYLITALLYIYIFAQSSKEKYADKWDLLFYMGLVSYLFTAFSNSDIARISNVFMIFQIIYVSKFFTSPKGVLPFWVFVIFHTLMRLYFTSKNMGGVLPYELSI